MKNIISLFLSFFFLGCGKSYFRVAAPNTASLTQIDLANYTIYKREKYTKIDTQIIPETFLVRDTPDVPRTYDRVETQFLAIENSPNAVKNVIYFSYIPNYHNGTNYFLNNPIYNNVNFINLDVINYMQFGKLRIYDASGAPTLIGLISFMKDKSLSEWDIVQTNNDVNVRTTTFLDRGKVKTSDVAVTLGIGGLYRHVAAPSFKLHFSNTAKCDNIAGDYDLVTNIMYIDNNTGDFYFEFTPNFTRCDGSWIRYCSNRVKARYQ